MTQAADSSSGTIIRTYDGLNELTEEQTPQGQISYTYYPNGLRESMTVQGQTPVSYTYDNADRLLQITQGTETVGIAYDTADRRTSVTLPNGVQMQYSYDAASELTGITYQNGSTSLGALTYAYDADGRRVGEGGSLAQVSLPAGVASASYDADNRLTQWGSVGLSYDADGNLTSFGSSAYTWNARNELVAASDGSSSFTYDAFGRRIAKAMSGATTTYLYDGANPVLVNSDFMLAGLGLDEYYAQISSSGTKSFLTNALGSVIALTDDTGAVVGNYMYEPYGATTQSGSSTIPFQFTGRENDGPANLYFFRARYYSPALSRFISQDPIGLMGGPNVYAYVAGDPISRTDPSGNISIDDALGAALQGAMANGTDAAMNGEPVGSATGKGGAAGLATGGFPGPTGLALSTAEGAALAPNGGRIQGAAEGAAGAVIPAPSGYGLGVIIAIEHGSLKVIASLTALLDKIYRCL